MTHQKTAKIELNAQKRELLGSKVSQLRNEGIIPAILYGKSFEAIPLQIPLRDFSKVLKEAGESTLVYLNVDGESYPTIIHDVTLDPLRDTVLHADFYKVRLDEKIKAMVPVEYVGEAPAVTDLKGIFVRNINELEVEALPQNLPHSIKVDISNMQNFGDQVMVKDIKLESDIILTANADDIIALVQEPISEEQLQKELESTSSIEQVEEIKKEKEEEPTEAEAASTTEEK